MDATFWATVGLVIFLAIIFYMKVPGKMQAGLDKRASDIEAELNEARKLREEAQELLAEFQRKRKAAEQEAQEIVSNAEREAAAIAEDAEKKTADHIARRTAQAEQKIASAEAQAVSDVKSAAVDIAVAAAEKIVASKAKGATADNLIKSGIAEVKARLN